MRIGVISQNLSELSVQANLNETSIISLSPDIYVEMTQEDGRMPSDEPLINKNLLNRYDHLITASLNGNQQTKQNIQTNIYVKQQSVYEVIASGKMIIAPKESQLRLGLQTIAKAIHTGFGYSKGMVYVKIKTQKRSFLFVNMHLPVKTKTVNGVLKNATLGLEFRKSSLFSLLNKLERDGLLKDDPAILVSGDLNFRMDKYGRDQLTNIIAKEPNRILNLVEMWQPDSEKRITCKFAKKNTACRLRKMPPQNEKNTVKNFLKDIQENCGNSMRVPSRCDRFLISRNPQINIKLNVTKYLVLESDHNAILSCYDIVEKNSIALKTFKARRHLV
jgi:hypothetical protein